MNFPTYLEAVAAGSFEELLNAGGEVFTWLIEQMGSFVNFVVANPIMLLPVIIMLAGLVVGMFSRAIGSLG